MNDDQKYEGVEDAALNARGESLKALNRQKGDKMSFRKIVEAAADAAIAAAEQEREQEETPRCPLCGYKMIRAPGEIVCWSCIWGHDHASWLTDKERIRRAFEYQRDGGVLKWEDLKLPPNSRYQNWDDTMFQTILAVSTNGWAFGTFWGVGDWMYFMVTPLDVNNSGKDLPIPSLDKWEWADWVGELPFRKEETE